MISNLIKNFNRKEVIEEVNVGPYLEFKSSTPMTITPRYTNSGVTLQYSLDTITWTNIAANGVTPRASVIYFRGSATGIKGLFNDSNNTSNAWWFTDATNLEANGDITMLLQDNLGGMVRDIPLGSNAFAYMFYNCTSLVTAPTLPSTTLARYCYSCMFYNCTSLTAAPTLPATTLADWCYFYMLRGCTSLITLPELPATTLAESCYQGMFYNCTSLTAAPTLPATTLANFCYYNMFYGCTSLTTVPSLPAIKLADFCYATMLNGCTKIKLSTTKTGNYQTAYRVPTVGTGTTNATALYNMFNNTGGTFKSTPVINTTYYTENTIV